MLEESYNIQFYYTFGQQHDDDGKSISILAYNQCNENFGYLDYRLVYSFTDYEENNYVRIRLIEKNYGPFIEISGVNSLFLNNSQ